MPTAAVLEPGQKEVTQLFIELETTTGPPEETALEPQQPKSFVVAFYSVGEAARSRYVYDTGCELAGRGYSTAIVDASLNQPSQLMILVSELKGKTPGSFMGTTLLDKLDGFSRDKDMTLDDALFPASDRLSMVIGNKLMHGHDALGYFAKISTVGVDMFGKMFDMLRQSHQYILVDAPHDYVTENIILKHHANMALAVESQQSRRNWAKLALDQTSFALGQDNQPKFPVYILRGHPVKTVADLIIEESAK